jgi:catechol 2,3-dioxygenase-like lactoylglutathione lyase family enzyme
MKRLTNVTEFRLKLYPENFELVRDFYRDILEYPIIKEWNRAEDDRGAMFDTGAAVLELLTQGDAYVPIQGADVSLQVRDVDALWEDLHRNVNVVRGLRNQPWGDRSFCISDPEGFVITFFTTLA